MGKVLDTYNRYRELLFTGDHAHLTDVVDEDFVETCVGLTGWTRGLDIATANFAAGIAAAFPDLTAQEYDHIEDGDTLVIRGRAEGTQPAGSSGSSRPDGAPRGSRRPVPARRGRPHQLALLRHRLEHRAAPAARRGARPARHTRAPRRACGRLGAI